jgi:hypothetical protein
MTETLSAAEKMLEAETLKAAWYEGFRAARHHPNHSQPILSVTWDGNNPTVMPNWKIGQAQLPGWIG